MSHFSHAIRRAVLAASALVVGALLALGMSAPAEANVAPVATITGRVTAPGGHGLAGISVRPYFFDGTSWTAVDGAVTSTASSGAYTLSALQPGSYRIGFNENAANRYLVDFTGNTQTLDSAVSLFVADGVAATVNATLVVGGTLAGKVTYSNGGHIVGANNIEPIARPLLPNGVGGFAGVNPNLSYVGHETSTSGVWSVPGLPTGEYVVDLHDTSGAPNSRTLDGYVGATAPVSHAATAQRFAVTVGHTTSRAGTTQLLLASASTDAPLVLNVEQPGGGAGVEGATVTLRSNDDANFFWSSAFDLGDGTDSAGQVTIPHVATGAYELTVTAPTYQPYVEDFSYNSVSSAKTVQLSELTALAWQDDIVPSIDGVSSVGETLTVAHDELNQDGGSVTFTWLRAGTPIYGQTNNTYTVRAGDIGADIAVLVTGSKWGFDTISHTATGGGVVAGAQLTLGATAPSIVPSGTVGYGSTLVFSPGMWSVDGASFHVDWYDDGGLLAHDTLSYAPPVTEIGHAIYASVVASKAGYSDSDAVPTSWVTVTTGPPVLTVKAPRVTSHTLANGSVQYTATGATWSQPGVQPKYSWLDDELSVGATSSVTIAKAHATHAIYLQVSGSLSGYADSSTTTILVRKGTERPVVGTAATVVTSPANLPVTATTPVATGTELSASFTPQDWVFPNGSNRSANSYQWYRQSSGHAAARITGATHASYTVGAADVGATLTVRETSSSADYASATSIVPAGVGSPAQLGSETISASVDNWATAGVTVTAKATTTWNTTGVSASGKWMSCVPSTTVDCTDGAKFTSISHATGANYVTQPSQRGDVLLYRVVASKAGYVSVTTDSAHLQLSSTDTQIRAETAPALPSPLLNEPARVGTKIAASTAHFDVNGVAVSYQWKVCDPASTDCTDQGNWHAASGAGGRTLSYAPTLADLGTGSRLIEIVATAARAGFVSGIAVSANTTIAAAAPRGSAPAITAIGITGDTFGETLSIVGADAFTYPVAASPVITYQWSINSKAIAGATAASFTPTAGQVGETIGVRVRAEDPGYADGTYSTSVRLLAAPEIVGAPVILPNSGIVPGTTLSVDTSSYAAGPTFTYQWEVKTGASLWTNIVGATHSTYLVASSTAGSQLKVDVKARLAGHIVGSLSAPAVAVGYSLDLESTSPPVLTGSGHAGSPLTVSTGSWSATGLAFTYQWYRNGVAIPGATSSTFVPLASSVGDDLNVIVTASHPGYETRSASSATVTVN